MQSRAPREIGGSAKWHRLGGHCWGVTKPLLVPVPTLRGSLVRAACAGTQLKPFGNFLQAQTICLGNFPKIRPLGSGQILAGDTAVCRDSRGATPCPAVPLQSPCALATWILCARTGSSACSTPWCVMASSSAGTGRMKMPAMLGAVSVTLGTSAKGGLGTGRKQRHGETKPGSHTRGVGRTRLLGSCQLS